MSALSTAAYRQAATFALDAAPAQRRMLYLHTYLASLVAVQVLHLAMDDITLNLGFSGGLTAGFIYSYYLEPRFRALTIYVDSAIAAGLAIYYLMRIRDDYAMYGNYLGILLGIMMVSLAFKAFAPGDFRFLLIPGTICVMFSSVASYDLKFMLLLPLYLVFAGCALYITNQVELSVRVAGTTGAPLNMRFGVSRRFTWELLRSVLGVILLSVTIYVLVPHGSQTRRSLILNAAARVEEDERMLRTAEMNREPDGGSGQAEVGLGADFNLAQEGELSADTRPVLRVKGSRNGYLRAQVYDVFTGSGWVQSPELAPAGGGLGGLTRLGVINAPLQPHAEANMPFSIPLADFPSRRYQDRLEQQRISLAEDNVYSKNDTADLGFETIRQEISLLERQPPFYFAVYQPFRLENISLDKSDRLLDEPLADAASVIRPLDLDRSHPQGFAYTVYSIEVQAGPGKLKQVYVPGPEPIVEHYTQLPLAAGPSAGELHQWGIQPEQYRPITQRLKNFATTLAQSSAATMEAPVSIWSEVQAIYDYLNSSQFVYSRQYRQPNPQQEVTEAFVLGTREGYCRHFASAMAVLCRLNGIPARVVTGYAPGTFSLVDNAYIVRGANAHAWVEAYFDEYGWITFDPTPASQDIVTRGAVKEQVASVIDFLQELFVLDPAATQRSLLAAVAALARAAAAHWPLATLIALVAAGSLGAWLLRRRVRSRRRSARPVPENAVIGAYVEALSELGRIGTRPAPADTARRYLAAAAGRHMQLAAPLIVLLPLYERAAFAPEPVSADDVAQARDALGAVRDYVAEMLKRSNGR